MMAVINKPLEVELVGEALASRLTGPVIIAVAAVMAAAVAAYVATRNHKRELNHDREERRRENTRIVLDGAIEVVIATLGTFADFEEMLSSSEERRAKLEEIVEDQEADAGEKAAARAAIQEIEKGLEQAFEGVTSIAREMTASNARLALRFGVFAPIPTAYEELDEAYRAYGGALAHGITANQTKDQKENLAAKYKATDPPFAHLMQLCESWHTG